ncbi:MAG: hypothetical protein LUD12_15010 [Lachnospiraceae bacterium]|nr:hypothetical protein [Lachnospiraceae bacterium]
MKKTMLSIMLSLALTLSLSATAFADVTQDSDPKTGTTTISTSISPTYTVTIPADTTITFNTTSTSIGNIELSSAQLDPGYAVKVSASAGALENEADASKTIPYTLKSDGSAFTSAQYTVKGEYTALAVDITEDDWNSAYAGSYSGTITFTVEYISTSN